MKKRIFLLIISLTTLHSANNLTIINTAKENSGTAAIELKGNGEYCQLQIQNNGKIDKGSCRYLVNSKGIKIYCTPGKKMCKTYDEIYAFFFNTQPNKHHLQKSSKRTSNSCPKVGSLTNGGVFLYRERVEMYWNDWIAYPLADMHSLPSFGQVDLTIRGEGKTTSFDGVLSINCENGKHFWKGEVPRYAVEEVPNEVYKNAVSLFCRHH